MVFLDLIMPVMDGVQAAHRLRAQWENCQIIFLTAYSDFDFMREALDLGAVDYLLKPFSQTGLIAAVQKASSRLKLLEQTREQLTERARLSEIVDERTLLDIASGGPPGSCAAPSGRPVCASSCACGRSMFFCCSSRRLRRTFRPSFTTVLPGSAAR